MCDYPANTKKGDQTRRYKAVYNQKSIRLAAAASTRGPTAATAATATAKAKTKGKR